MCQICDKSDSSLRILTGKTHPGKYGQEIWHLVNWYLNQLFARGSYHEIKSSKK